ncbi:uncharacterized protein LOC132314427 [Cornus florida]|uniref:uncharacterized protein LOC132314427 n=1 Tax=Cornus florida TaxID=4283 RepID=UPI00289701ED|nr:uncharacterized protein LOC132314427 [Cornus florida]
MSDNLENQYQSIKKDNEKLPVPETPVSGERKLTIKFKIRNVEKGVEENPIRRQGKNSQSKVCTVCKKEFISGKALGGHVKVHFQDHNKEQLLKQLKIGNKKPKKLKKQNLQWAIYSSKKRDSNEVTNESSEGNGKPTVCFICRKKFSSPKALFGHMRCHHEKERRGIESPMAVKNSQSSSVSESKPRKIDDHVDSDGATVDNPVIDLMESLPMWPVTGRRMWPGTGRRTPRVPRVVADTLENSSSEEVEVEKKRFCDAVDEFLRLAQDNSFDSGLVHNDKIEEYEVSNCNALTNEAEIEDKHRVSESNKRRIEASPVGYRRDYPVKKLRIEEGGFNTNGGHIGVVPTYMDKGKGKAILETQNCEWVDAKDWNREVEDYMNCTDDEYSDIKDTEDLCEGQLTNYKWERTSPRSVMISSKKIKRNKPIVRRSTPNKYQCSNCDRGYSIKQALGGHMSYHKRDKNFHNTIDDPSSAAAEDKHHHNPASRVDGELVQNTHQCEICNGPFLTGQALGGHKRFCPLSSSPVEAPSSLAASPGEASQTVRKILGFDLNELPPMEDEEW